MANDEELQPSTSDEGADDGEPEEQPEEDVDDQEVDDVEGDEDETPSTRTRSDEEFRKLQSKLDVRMSALERAIQQKEEELKEERRLRRQLELSTLPEDQRRAREKELEIEDRQAEIDEMYNRLNLGAKEIHIRELLLEHRRHGLTREDLEGCNSIDQMDAVAAKKEAEFYKRQASAAKKTPKQNPAISHRPIDSGQGSGAPAYDPKRYRGTGKLADSLRAKREAGLL